MTLHAHYQSIASTGPHPYFQIPASGMIYSITVGHLCGDNFKSKCVEGLEGLNTEICEQVNSYLQSIKYTGVHLSQEKFMFFTQFFLYLLNKKKTTNFNRNANVALAFQL